MGKTRKRSEGNFKGQLFNTPGRMTKSLDEGDMMLRMSMWALPHKEEVWSAAVGRNRGCEGRNSWVEFYVKTEGCVWLAMKRVESSTNQSAFIQKVALAKPAQTKP